MKYLTKEFYAMQSLAYAHSYVRKSKQAEKVDEDFYMKCYDNQCAIFLKRDRMASWYVDPIKELREIEEYANEPDISVEERKLRKFDLEAHIYANKERIESGKFYKFDKELSRQRFEVQQDELIALYSRLPKEIKDKIADMRVFALGYASEEVKRLLKPYCRKLRSENEAIYERAYGETNDAEKLLTRPIGLNDFEEKEILGMAKRGDKIYLKFEDCYLVFKNGEVTEGQCTPIYPLNHLKPNCPWSLVLNTELHFHENKFEVNFLINNFDETEKTHLWYLTVTGTDIIKFYEYK